MSPLIRAQAHKVSTLILQEIDWLQPNDRDRKLIEEDRDLKVRRREIENAPGYAADESLMKELASIEARLRALDAALKSYRNLTTRRLTWAKDAGNSTRIAHMIAEARVMLARAVDDMDQGALDVNTLSGVLRFTRIPNDPEAGMTGMSSVELIPHDRAQLLTKIMPVIYDPDAKCPRFDSFLEQIQPNIEMRRFLQRWFGLSMTGWPCRSSHSSTGAAPTANPFW